MTLDQVLAQSQALIGDVEFDDDDEVDDDDLMAELGDILGDDDEDMLAEIADSPPPAAPAPAQVQKRAAPQPPRPVHHAPQPSSNSGQSPLAVASERREIYVAMQEKAKAAGEGSKVRRYQRIITQCDTALKTIKAGRPFDLSTLPEPPPGFTVKPAAPQPAAPQPAAPQPAAPQLVAPAQPAAPQPAHQQPVMTGLGSTSLTTNIAPVEEPLIDLGDETMTCVQDQPAAAPLPQVAKPGQLNVNVVDLLNHMEQYNEPEHKVENHVVTLLKERGGRYREVALNLHKQGRTDEAKQFLGISKQFEAALSGYMLGDNVDLSLIPPDPTEYMATKQGSSEQVAPPPASNPAPVSPVARRPAGVLVSDEQATIVALNFRLDAYKKQQEKAQAEGNGSKARRMGRVITQCQDVIKAVKLKRPVDFNSLPELPGAEPIPLPPYMSGARPAAAGQPALQPTQQQPAQPRPAPQPAQQPAQTRPAPQPAQQPAQPANSTSSGGDTLAELHQRMLFLTDAAEKAKAQGNGSKARRMMRLIEQHQQFVKDVKSRKPIDMSAIPDLPGFEAVPVPDYMRAKRPAPAAPQARGPAPAASQVSVKDQLKQSTADKNMEILLTRQAEYKQEALKLYKEGDQVGAKKYLAQAKGFDQMIEACKKGLPVEMSKIPPSLSAPPERRVLSRQNTLPHMSGEVINMGPSSGDVEEIFNQLVSDLEHQIELCKKNATTFQKLGDLPSAKHYAQLFQNQSKDLANLKGIYKQKKGLPPYRYEGCKFPVLNSSPELSDREAEVVIVRCLNVPVPQGWKPEDLKVYVTWEFTIQDKTAKGQTKSYKKGINPDIFEQFRVDIGDRTARSFARAIKRGSCKFTAWYERGFLKKPGELGSAVVKLADWENLAEIHEAATLLDGRKQTATKVEVKLRIREPVGGAQCEFSEMKWLVIGRSGHAPTNPKPSLSVPKKGRTGTSPNVRRRQ
ncbi:hypothetical protein ACHWQZ_G016999 [Mnemiopsis leidyi]